MNNACVSQFLKEKVGLFQNLLENRLTEVVEGSRIVSYEPNEAIVEFGDEVCFLGVILEGQIEFSLIAKGERKVLGQLQAPDTFGEVALMTGEKAMANVIASTRCQVLLIPITLFRTLIMPDLHAVQRLSKIIAERARMIEADPEKAAQAFRQSEDPYGLQLKGERPEKVAIINCGSSSLKYSIYDTVDEKRNARGLIERINSDGMRHTYHGPQGSLVKDLPKGNYGDAFQAMIKELTAAQTGVLSSPREVSVVGHRVVHGGEKFSEAVIITEEIIQEIDALSALAPLHNPVNVIGIREAQKVFPSAPHVAVFDTAFHRTLPSYAYLYGLPYEFYEEKGVRRYGFHGMSHIYVCLKAAEHLKLPFNELEIVSCHLGNGASVCAVDHGRSVDTSMGFTPTEGLIMGTRSGDLDPGLFAYLQRSTELNAQQIEEMLNKRSGLLGLSGISSDMREIEKAAQEGNPRALVALKAFCYRVRKYIGAYVAAMGGLDVIIFTGGIGQGSAGVRSLALQGMHRMGIFLDEELNREADGFAGICRITMRNSPIAVLVVPTDEERMIARESLRALSRSYIQQVLETQRRQPIPIEVSAHHVHLSQEHVEALFGPGHELTKEGDLSQPGQYACAEKVNLVGPKGRVERVRVLGPTRKASQVEIAMTEQYKLGIHPPIRESGDLRDTPGITLEGPAGKAVLSEGVICALRHIHIPPEDALRYGLRDRSTVKVRVKGDRELVFGDVRVRVDPNFKLAMHIDTDEGNAGGLKTGDEGFIEGIQSQD